MSEDLVKELREKDLDVHIYQRILELFIIETIPDLRPAAHSLAAHFINNLEKRGVFDKNKESSISLPLSFNYGDGQTARVRKEIISGDLKVPKGAVLIKNGDKYQTPKGPGEMYDIPANQVEGNGEFFEFPDADGNYKTLASIIKMIPTPSLDLD